MPDIQIPIGKYVGDRAFSTLSSEASVADALEALRASGTESVLVTTPDGAIQGIFTQTDFLERVLVPDLDVERTPVASVMTEAPDVLGWNAPISYAINRMALQGFRSIPVVDAEGRAVAMFDVRDVIEHLSELLGELDQLPDENPTTSSWIDIGGGG